MQTFVVATGATFITLILLHVYWRRVYFSRDPERTINREARVIAPADGRVIYLKNVDDGTIPISIKDRDEIPLTEIVKGIDGHDSGVLMGIFLSPMDVHYQRSPIAGQVTNVTYHRSKSNQLMSSMFWRNVFGREPLYSNSRHIVENERNVVRIVNDDFELYVVQIADKWVNKIDCYVKTGESVEAGQKIGMIRMGSQVDLFIPGATVSSIAENVQIGEKVYAGVSTIIV